MTFYVENCLVKVAKLLNFAVGNDARSLSFRSVSQKRSAIRLLGDTKTSDAARVYAYAYVLQRQFGKFDLTQLVQTLTQL